MFESQNEFFTIKIRNKTLHTKHTFDYILWNKSLIRSVELYYLSQYFTMAISMLIQIRALYLNYLKSKTYTLK